MLLLHFNSNGHTEQIPATFLEILMQSLKGVWIESAKARIIAENPRVRVWIEAKPEK